ncbi:histone acetyltransferase of the CBP family 12 [Actinidia rufa]|uniref:histone acetyltransferase n=1 Tax=Actinidia rufa TaxID=165716 RepID=A0A7J0GBQ1_9ERIC|nr:histone acetyltransferase of the CBP family 12 [Actinidia rufa]
MMQGTLSLYGTLAAKIAFLLLIHLAGDGYGLSTPDSSASGNFCAPVNSAGPAMNNQDLNPANLQSLSRTNSPLRSNQSNFHTIQEASLIKSQPIDQSEKMNFQASTSLQENLFQSNHQQQFHQHPLQLQQQLVQHQRHPKQQIQRHQILLKDDSFDHSQLTSDLGRQLKPEHGTECHDGALHSQGSEQFQFSELQNQFQQSPAENHTQLLSPPSVSQDLCSSVTQTSQQMQQLLQPHQMVIDSHNDFSCLVGVQSDRLLPGQWHLKSQDQSQMPVNLSHEQNIHLEFRQRLTGQDEAQCNNLSSEGSVCHTVVTNTAKPPTSGGATCRSANPNREWQFKCQQRWLLFLRHARRCMAPEGKCPEVNCINAQKLWIHILHCSISQCPYPRCHHTKILLNHHKHCRDADCPVCVPVERFIQRHLKARACSDSTSDLPCSINGSCKLVDTGVFATQLTSKMSPPVVETSEDLQPLLKRIKTEQPSQPLVLESESSTVSVPTGGEPHVHIDAPRVEYHGDNSRPMKAEVAELKMEFPVRSGQGCPDNSDMKKDNLEDNYIKKPVMKSIMSNDPSNCGQLECLQGEKDMDRAKQVNMTLPAESIAGTKSGKPKIKGVSMTELFTPEQVTEHIMGLRRWVGQSKSKAEKNQAMEHSMSENSCQLCAVEKLTFEPPPIYCTPCGARIKRNAMYYTIGAGDTRHYFCIPCYNEARGDTILVDGTAVPKARLEKKKNDEETEEWWVQCDKCEAWQHQICALFNGRRNDGGQAEYTCPYCYIGEIERGERKPLPQSSVLGAKDLPRTILSDHIEQRLFRRLKQERQERARLQGKSYDEVPGAEALVVRVVSSVDKKLEVKQRFLEIFQEENYPIEYPYKSKNLDQSVNSQITAAFISHIWIPYLSMLRKAAKENVIVDLTNLYDHFFVSTGECKAKVTAARLPYFDGDYWPGAAEDMIYQIRQEEDNRKQQKKGTTKKTITKRALKLSGQSDLSGNASKDLLLMHKLGETICPMKEDFIMVHLQHACTHCCILMISGNRWVCNQCKNFQLCDKCYETEQKLERERQTSYQSEGQAHTASYTKDKDEILESEFFDTRQAFLSLCQGNHYQYDTLRRAKHSSIMVLYHLHNPTAPAFVTTCNMCHLDIEAGQGWRCEICPDYDVCNSCYQKDGGIDHPHQLTNHPSMADRDAQNQEARELRVLQLRKMLDLLVHASQCRSPHCQYPNCRKVKSLFRHGIQCKTRASGGCALCKKMWYLLQLHARACKESQCHVPRCRDLKEHLRRLQQQSDSRRRAAVMEMMRQRAAEVAGNAE